MVQWKRNHPGQQRRQSIRKNSQRKNKKACWNQRITSRGHPRQRNLWPPHNTETNDPRNQNEGENSICNLPGCPESIWQGMAGCHPIRPPQERNPGEKSQTCQEAKLKPNSKNPNQIWPNGTDKDQGQHKTRRSAISHRICNTNGWNRQRTTKQKPGHRNRPRCNNRLPTMDGRCMPNPPRQKQAPKNAGHNKPYSQEIPHRIWSRQMQGSENRQRPKKLPSTQWHHPRRSPHIQIPRRYDKQQRRPNSPHQRNRRQGHSCHTTHTNRDRKQRIQRNENASNMATNRRSNNTNHNIWSRKLGCNKKGNRRDTKDPQQLPENYTMPNPRNPDADTPGRNRIPPNTILHL